MTVEANPEVVAELRRKLLHPSTSLQQKYRVLFSLRNIKGKQAHEAMLAGVHSVFPHPPDQPVPGGGFIGWLALAFWFV